MAVIFNCNYCGKEIKDSIDFDGVAVDFQKFIENKTNELSEKCECRKSKKVYVRLRGACSCVGNVGDLEFIDKEYEIRESIWIDWKDRFKSHDLENSNIDYDIQDFLENELKAEESEYSYIWQDGLFCRDWAYITEENVENERMDFAFRYTDKEETTFGEITVSDKPQKDCKNIFIFSSLDLC